MLGTCPATEGLSGRAGAIMALHPAWLAPNLVRQAKGSKGHLRPPKTCDTSNAGTFGWLPKG